MDIEGVDVAALFRTNGGTWIVGLDDLEPDYAAALCRAYNNWMRDYCATDPDRLKGIALLPLQALDLAIEEARRAVTELRFVGVTVHTEPVNGRLLYDEEVEPLWTEVERLGAAVCLHGTSTAPGREDISRKFLRHPSPRTMTHALSFPTQIMGAMAGLTMTGVLERHPRCASRSWRPTAGGCPGFSTAWTTSTPSTWRPTCPCSRANTSCASASSPWRRMKSWPRT